MYVITVVPLRRGVSIDALSYFSSVAYEPGNVVTIPVRNSTSLGLVTEIHEVSRAKTALRAATFSLRKLPPQKHVTTLGNAFIATAKDIATHYASSLGLSLIHILPHKRGLGQQVSPSHPYGASQAQENCEAVRFLQS